MPLPTPLVPVQLLGLFILHDHYYIKPAIGVYHHQVYYRVKSFTSRVPQVYAVCVAARVCAARTRLMPKSVAGVVPQHPSSTLVPASYTHGHLCGNASGVTVGAHTRTERLKHGSTASNWG